MSFDVAVVWRWANTGCVHRVAHKDALLLYTLMPLLSCLLVVLAVFAVRGLASEAAFMDAKVNAVWIVLQICFVIYAGVSSRLLQVRRNFIIVN